MGKRRRKRSGHWCWCCARHRPNEKFSGRGHRRHLCKDCAGLGKDELEFRSGVCDVDQLVGQIMFGGRRKRSQSLDALRRIASTDARSRVREYAARALSEDEARHRGHREMMQAEQLEFEALMDDAVGDESWQEMTKGEADDEVPF